jgi:hypothetical protein
LGMIGYGIQAWSLALGEGAAALDAGQQPLAPPGPAGPPCHPEIAEAVPATVVHRMTVDHAAAGAGLLLAGQLDHGDKLVVLIDVSVGQDELGQGEQQLGLPLERGRSVTRTASVARMGSHLEHRGRTCLHQASAAGSPTTDGKTRHSCTVRSASLDPTCYHGEHADDHHERIVGSDGHVGR